jgi:hypothetical protein
MGDRFNNYPKRREAVARYLRANAGIPTLQMEQGCGHLMAPWGRTGYVTSSRVREDWAREVRAHRDDPLPYFVVQRIGDWDLEDSMVYMSLRHLSVLLEAYYKHVVMPREKAGE